MRRKISEQKRKEDTRDNQRLIFDRGQTYWDAEKLKVIEGILEKHPDISRFKLTAELNRLLPGRGVSLGSIRYILKKMENAKRVREEGI